MELSCGLLLKDKKTNRYLVCHSTGKSWKGTTWDIPKGHIDKGESPKQCALRELQEETGIDLPSSINLKDCGQHRYTSYKNLHIFYYEGDFLPKYEKALKCTTYFVNPDGDEVPEVNAFAWVTPEKLQHYVFPSLWKVISKINSEQQLF